MGNLSGDEYVRLSPAEAVLPQEAQGRIVGRVLDEVGHVAHHTKDQAQLKVRVADHLPRDQAFLGERSREYVRAGLCEASFAFLLRGGRFMTADSARS